VITTYHDVLPLIIPGFFESDEKEQAYRQRVQADLDRTDLLITDSQYSAREIMSHFRVRAEPRVIYLAPFLKSDGIRSTQRRDSYFLYVGGYDPRKGIEMLLRVFIGLRREGLLSGRLILTGHKAQVSDELCRLIRQGSEMGAVEELGYVSDPTLHGLYADATALVYPSKYEGFGLPPLEAMAIGCPVITVRSTSIPEVCGDAVCYVDPDDESDLARNMVALEKNPDRREQLRAKGKVQAAGFSWSRSAQKFIEEVTAVCKKSSRGAAP
jgi:glycosyltransferase involved in cell wall biosynthesis